MKETIKKKKENHIIHKEYLWMIDEVHHERRHIHNPGGVMVDVWLEMKFVWEDVQWHCHMVYQ